MTHIEFLKNHPEIATLEYMAYSKITDELEVCSDHPTIRYRNGQTIDGIPDVDRLGMFGVCVHADGPRIRCTCPVHSLCGKMFDADGNRIMADKGTEDYYRTEFSKPTYSGDVRLKEIAEELKKKPDTTEIDKENRILALQEKYSSVANDTKFCKLEGRDIRPEDECLIELFGKMIQKMNQENRPTKGKRIL